MNIRSPKYLFKYGDSYEFLLAITSIILSVYLLISSKAESSCMIIDESGLVFYLFLSGIISLVRLLWPTKPSIYYIILGRSALSFSFLVLLFGSEIHSHVLAIFIAVFASGSWIALLRTQE